VNSGAFCTVNLSLLAKPYGRGASATATLSAATATSKAPHVFTTTGVKGDMPALGTLTITNVTNPKAAFWWGIQSRYYDAAATANLFYEAENCTLSAGALNAGPAGASGGGANKVVRMATMGTTGSVPFLLDSTSTPTHIGTFRVLARVQASAANTGTVSVRWQWRSTESRQSGSVSNDWVQVADTIASPVEGSWVIVDLGLVSIPKAVIGTQYWQGWPQCKSTVAADVLDFDWVALVPVDEGYGKGDFIVGTGSSTFMAAVDEIVVAYNAVRQHVTSGGVYVGVPRYAGDYLRLPPAGAEGRTLRVLCLLAGDSGTNISDTLADAVNLDATTATLTYSPRYLVVPSP
jgi:hypothetical protein